MILSARSAVDDRVGTSLLHHPRYGYHVRDIHLFDIYTSDMVPAFFAFMDDVIAELPLDARDKYLHFLSPYIF